MVGDLRFNYRIERSEQGDIIAFLAEIQVYIQFDAIVCIPLKETGFIAIEFFIVFP